MPECTPISVTEAQLDGVAYNADGLVPAIIQEEGTGRILMMAWMNDESLRRSLETGHLVLEPQPPGVLVQGRELWRPPVHPGGLLRLRRRHPALHRGAGGERRLPHR